MKDDFIFVLVQEKVPAVVEISDDNERVSMYVCVCTCVYVHVCVYVFMCVCSVLPTLVGTGRHWSGITTSQMN